MCSEEFFHFLFSSRKIGSPTFSAIMKISLRLLLMCYVKKRNIDRYSWLPINIFEKLSTALSKYTYGQSHNAASIWVLLFSITYAVLAQDLSGSWRDKELRFSSGTATGVRMRISEGKLNSLTSCSQLPSMPRSSQNAGSAERTQ